MQKEIQEYYKLCELFDVSGPVTKVMSAFLEARMKAKVRPAGSYAHTQQWWIPQQALFSRTPFLGSEQMTFLQKPPAEWGMNLLMKALKYCTHDLVARYGSEWEALDGFITTRNTVFRASEEQKKITETDSGNAFQSVNTAFSALMAVESGLVSTIATEMGNVEMLKNKTVDTVDGVQVFHDNLVVQKQEWKKFEEKLYERGGKPTLEQLRCFHARRDENILLNIGTNFRAFGAYILEDGDGQIVRAISRNMGNFGDTEDIATSIVQRWLGGTGVSATWENLAKGLIRADLKVLATDIEKKFV